MIISPKTKIGELLEAYPELETVLIEMSPAFKKLRNPVLRRTIARVATIQQISVVGGIPVDTIVNLLRKEAGQSDIQTEGSGPGYITAAPPSWFDVTKITQRFDATPVINAGESPMNEILGKAMNLRPGEIFELQTPFVPAPILDMLREKKFQVHTVQKAGSVKSYITKSQ
jgi:hypothetical protein